MSFGMARDPRPEAFLDDLLFQSRDGPADHGERAPKTPTGT